MYKVMAFIRLQVTGCWLQVIAHGKKQPYTAQLVCQFIVNNQFIFTML